MYTNVKNNKLKAVSIFPLAVIVLSACAPYYAPQPVESSNIVYRVGVPAATPEIIDPQPQPIVEASDSLAHIPFAEVIDVPTSFNVNTQATRQQVMTMHDQRGRPYRVAPNDGMIAQQQPRPVMNTAPHPNDTARKPIPAWALPYEQGDVSPALKRTVPATAVVRQVPYQAPQTPSPNRSSAEFQRWIEDGDRIFTESNLYTVKKGESVFQIMRSTGVHWEEIIRLNNLQPPFRLDVGQKLRLR